jgi:hypothetical protein
MELTIWESDESDIETFRDDLSRCADETAMVRHYLRHEPHTLLHTGRLTRFVDRHGIAKAGKAFSVGLDPLKEFYLSRLCGLSLHVVDRDRQAIASAAARAAALALPCSYEAGDIFEPPLMKSLKDGPYATLFLSQMDYLFSDEELSALFAGAAANPAMKQLLILSPSLFRWPGRDWHSCAKETLRVCFNVARSLVKVKKAGTHQTYMRSVGRLRRLAGPAWTLGPVERYDYPSGTMHLLLFRR